MRLKMLVHFLNHWNTNLVGRFESHRRGRICSSQVVIIKPVSEARMGPRYSFGVEAPRGMLMEPMQRKKREVIWIFMILVRENCLGV